MRDMRHLWHDLQSFYRLQKGAIFIGVDGAGQQAYDSNKPNAPFLSKQTTIFQWWNIQQNINGQALLFS